jgi:hypothetical protein
MIFENDFFFNENRSFYILLLMEECFSQIHIVHRMVQVEITAMNFDLESNKLQRILKTFLKWNISRYSQLHYIEIVKFVVIVIAFEKAIFLR